MRKQINHTPVIGIINENSGFNMQYQINGVCNLKLAAKTIHRVVIGPDETPYLV